MKISDEKKRIIVLNKLRNKISSEIKASDTHESGLNLGSKKQKYNPPGKFGEIFRESLEREKSR